MMNPNDALKSLSAMLRENPDVATLAVSREELNAVVGGVMNDARRRKEMQEKDAQSLKYMATISPHVLNFLAPILRGPDSLSMMTSQWLRLGGVSVVRAAGGGCIVAATNCKTMAIAYDAQATLSTPDGVQEMRFTVPDCILEACRPPVAPKLIPPGGEAEELPQGICDLTVPHMVYASGGGIFVTPQGNPSKYSDGDEDGCDEWPEGGVLATAPVSIHELSDKRYSIMENHGEGNIINACLPLLAWAQENIVPVSRIGMGADATSQMTDCMARILEWMRFNPFRVNDGTMEAREGVSIGYGDVGWDFGVAAYRQNDPLKNHTLTYRHGSGRYVLLQSEFMTKEMPGTPKADWFTPESKEEGA